MRRTPIETRVYLRTRQVSHDFDCGGFTKLRRTVRQISGSQCGGPIDLTKDTGCTHCGAPIGLVDPDGVAKAVHDLTIVNASILPAK